MARLKFLLVAVAALVFGYLHASRQAAAVDVSVRQAADDRLRLVAGAIGPVLIQDGQAALATARAAAGGAVTQALAEDGTPTAEALEAARALIEKTQSVEAERPTLWVVSAQGVAGRARTGQSNRFDPNLLSFPPLSEPGALPRGGLGVLDGDTFRYAIAALEPARAGNRGAVTVGFPLDDGFAAKLRRAAGGVDIALLEKGKVTGTTLPAADRGALDGAAKAGVRGAFGFGALTGEGFALTELIPPLARAIPLPLFAGGFRYRAQVLPSGGTNGPALPEGLQVVAAVRTEAGYAVLADDQRSLLVGLSAIVLLCLLLMVSSGDPARGLRRVVSAAERIVQGDYDLRVPTDRMTPLVRRAAVALNTLATHAANAVKPSAPSFAEQLGIKPSRGVISQPPPTAAGPEESADPFAGFSEGPPAAAGAAAAGGVAGGATGAAISPAASPLSSSPSISQPSDIDSLMGSLAPSPDESHAAGLSQLPETPAPSAIPLAAPPRPRAGVVPAPQSLASTAADPAAESLAGFMSERGSPAAVGPAASGPAAALAEPPPRGGSRSATFNGGLTGSGASAVPLPGPGGPSPAGGVAGNTPAGLPAGSPAGSEDGHFQQVFREFITTRERCGEPADGLTYEKFAAKLRKNQEQLVAKYACRSVRFQVYVKEGKAALKATPVR